MSYLRWNPWRESQHKQYLSMRRITLLRHVILSIHFIYHTYTQKPCHYVVSMPPNYSFRNAGRIAPYGVPDPSLTIPSSTYTTLPNHVLISSRCSCGGVLIEFPYPINTNISVTNNDDTTKYSTIDCHCPTCRRYHMAAFVRYLEIPDNGVSVSGDTVVRYHDTCSEAGSVQRVYCRRCSSKVLTTRSTTMDDNYNNINRGMNSNSRFMPPLPIHQSSSISQSTVLINMGPIDNQRVPTEVMEQWKQTNVRQWSRYMEASWARTTMYDIVIANSKNYIKPPIVRVTGGCTCGLCQYEFDYIAPSEMQHCYCNLCRQLSGGMFMTWVPVSIQQQNFRWINHGYVITNTNNKNIQQPQHQQLSSIPDTNRQDATTDGSHIPLVRYTDIGKRHMCSQCGSNLSILYDSYMDDEYDYDDDEDDRVIWLSAAGFDSIRFPFRVEPYLSRLLHICCRFKPKWYPLPKDGIPRIKDAS
jgi:hypothetical protein